MGCLGHRNHQIVGIAGKRQKAEGRMKKKDGGMEKSEAKGQSSTGPRGSEGAQNMGRAALREAASEYGPTIIRVHPSAPDDKLAGIPPSFRRP